MAELVEGPAGIWSWTCAHPDWRAGEDWAPAVRSWAIAGPDGITLVDPLAGPGSPVWDALDTLAGRRGPVRAIVRTRFSHQRSIAAAADRYGAPVWARPRPRPDLPEVAADRPLLDRTELGGGLVAHHVNRDDEVALWHGPSRSLVFADVVQGTDGGVELCPEWWLATPEDAWQRLRTQLDDLAAERDPVHLLVSHGAAPAAGDGAGQLHRAVARAARRPLPPFVDPDDLLERRGRFHLIDTRLYLDGRDDVAAVSAAHLPGAVHLPFATALSAPPGPDARRGRHPLPDPERFAAALSDAGVSDGDTVVAYDDLGGLMAARLIWLLRSLGEDAALLAPVPPASAWTQSPMATPEPGRFSVRPWPPEAIVDLEAVAARDPATVLVDPRDPARFRGEHEPLDPRPGHIPGAVNLPGRDTVDADGRPRPWAELQARFAELGTGPVIASCGSGVTACHTLLMLEYLHRAPGRLYPGSYSEWSRRDDLPVATGP